jgi:hypothetical protein
MNPAILSLAAISAVMTAPLTLLPSVAEAYPNLPMAQIAQASENTINTRWFSVRYPAHWIISSVTDDYLILFNQQPPERGGGEAPPFMIKTDITLISTPLENVTTPSSRYEETILRVERLTINGQQAIRVWKESGHAFSHAITTYVYYNAQQTASITSFYNAQNTAAEAAIESVHNSFRLLR